MHKFALTVLLGLFSFSVFALGTLRVSPLNYNYGTIKAGLTKTMKIEIQALNIQENLLFVSKLSGCKNFNFQEGTDTIVNNVIYELPVQFAPKLRDNQDTSSSKLTERCQILIRIGRQVQSVNLRGTSVSQP